VLILQNCSLQSLDNLPEWDLYVIDLTQNKYYFLLSRISQSEFTKLLGYKNLNQLICQNNDVQQIEPLKALAAL